MKEYKLITMCKTIYQTEDLLNELSEEGWQLSFLDSGQLILERDKK